jgi:hypothetical protein
MVRRIRIGELEGRGAVKIETKTMCVFGSSSLSFLREMWNYNNNNFHQKSLQST